MAAVQLAGAWLARVTATQSFTASPTSRGVVGVKVPVKGRS